jgi:predicted HTH transcriptional regulator
MGRLWQTLILSKWHDVFVNIPVESLVHQYQEDYYAAIRQSTKLTDSSPFIEFMLRMILNAIETSSRQNEGLNEGLNLSAVDKAILELIAQDVFITNIAISEKLTKSISTIERHIKMLKESNLLQRVGSKKTGHWKILK